VTPDGRPTSAQLRDVRDDYDRLRSFVEWCARLDQPDPEPFDEHVRQSLTVQHIAVAAREALA
jgi:hypothetical protein